MAVRPYHRNLFQRLLGRPQTAEPADAGCWLLEGGEVSLTLARVPELGEGFGAVRLEGRGLPHPVLVLRDGAGHFRAYRNACPHGGRRLDPVPGTETVCCCSVGRSTFDLEGRRLSGSAREPIRPLAVEVREGSLRIRV